MMMSREGFLLIGLVALFLALSTKACIPTVQDHYCTPSSCGNIHNISYPFRLKGDPPNCGDQLYELACENSRTILYLSLGKYYVHDISYVDQTMRVVDASLDNNSCSLPHYSLTTAIGPFDVYLNSPIGFLNCTTQLLKSSRYVNFTPCINNSSSTKDYFFYASDKHLLASNVSQLCRIQLIVPASISNITGLSVFDIHQKLLMGFQVSWDSPQIIVCNPNPDRVTFWRRVQNFWESIWDQFRNILVWDYYSRRFWIFVFIILGAILAGRAFLGILCFTAFVIYKFKRRHLSVDDAIEEYLQSHNNFMPIRYSYSEIKEMTKSFKVKLGQGGFGSVYRGKFRSGHLVAVKVLGVSKANGQDFISEVATIGRIHHVNVVRLLGFCAEGSKRALIYDFMANGSLDKFIFGGENISPLSWERMYEICLGVARGMEYLHRGCDMQILHFDIKPHNILLDENFIPKVTDFGLAKLYPIDDSIVSLTAARGTLGYIAPELFYKNIGGVSYKADVYSFGMLLMEMVGKRKIMKAISGHSNMIYFPSWIYDQLKQGEDIMLGDASENEEKFARKMIIVALWCIQLKPTDRPSMSKALEMLEGEVELLQMPPRPFLYNQQMDDDDDNAHANSKDMPNSSQCDITMSTFDGR